jgi:two-component system, LytTR family, sensor kinase
MKFNFTDTQQKIIFHLFLWTIWLYLSLSNVNDAELHDRAIKVITLIVTTHIPLFVLNTEWLIPKILQKKGVSTYFWSLIVVVIVFTGLHNVILDCLQQLLNSAQPWNRKSPKGIIPLILVAAISTGYGLLHYVVVQEKQQQEKQKEQLQAELSFLRSQISPHFIFNVLNSIVYLIRIKSDFAEPVTLKLSELMRYMLYESENAQIALEKEVSYLKNYIELQKVRFEEDVEIVFKTEGAAAMQRIEPMLLIPFVENAFKHGVGLVMEPIIAIELKISEHALHFMVKNKIAPETATNKDRSSGIGLKNVQRRLELLYPETHQLTIQNQEHWFEVTLDLTF